MEPIQKLNKTKKRNELEISTEILRVAVTSIKRSEIGHRCNLSKTALEKHLYTLNELNLLMVEHKAEELYRTTEKGLEVLRTYHYIKSSTGLKTLDFFLVRLLGRLLTNKKRAGVKKSTQRYIV